MTKMLRLMKNIWHEPCCFERDMQAMTRVLMSFGWLFLILGAVSSASAHDTSIHLDQAPFGYFLESTGRFSTEDSGWHRSDIAGTLYLRCDFDGDRKWQNLSRIELASKDISISKKYYAPPLEYLARHLVEITVHENNYGITTIRCSCETQYSGVCDEEIAQLGLTARKT